MKKNYPDIFNINLTLSDLSFLYNQISLNRSFMRASHNLFLKKKLNIKGLTADLGSGINNDYYNYISKSKLKVDQYDFHKIDKKAFILDLEKKFKLKKNYNNILLFNVLEHIFDGKTLLNSIKKNLKKEGKLNLFVPFMFRFHSDPNDFMRPTHSYLKKILEQNGFKVQITLIATGPMLVILEILFKYLKLNIFKFLFSILFISLNKFFSYFSKDFKNYYCGTHCSCTKIK
ncbi:class I SAM-dependent methyltransferase [Candidatus Pelagibacter sp.]|nr:class I SAM-dependent methyltransferase [Candidatus Pelagibacter sp.]